MPLSDCRANFPGLLDAEQMRTVLLAAGARAGETRPKLFQALDVHEAVPRPLPRRDDPTSMHVRARIARQRDAEEKRRRKAMRRAVKKAYNG